MKRLLVRVASVIFCVILAVVFMYPVLQGLVLLPLDLLASNYSPWHFASTILLKNAYMQDSILQLFPWRHLTFTSLTSGIVPFWNPYQFMGMPFMAGMKSMVWYPVNLLFGLGEVPSWHALLLFQLYGSMLFMYIFVCSLGVKRIPAMLSAVSFAFSSLMVGVLEFGSEGNVLLWLPFFLYVVKRYMDSRSGIYLLGLGLGTACAIFAGHLQYLAYEIITVSAFVFVYGKTVRATGKTYLSLLVASILGFGVAAIQLVPGIEMFRASYRGMANSYDVFSSGLLKPFQLIRLFAPDFFGHPLTRDLQMGYIEQSGYFGIIPLFFALYAMWYERKNISVKFFSYVFFLGLLFSLDGFAQILYRLHIPIITSGFGGRIFFMTLASGAILSGYGLSSFVNNSDNSQKRWSLPVYILLTVLLLAGSFYFGKFFHIPFPALANIKFPFIILTLFALVSLAYHIGKKFTSKAAGIVFILALVAITYFDLFRLGYRFLTFSNSKFLYPDSQVLQFIKSESVNSMARVYGLAEPELPTYMGVYSVETYNPLYPMRTGILFHTLSGDSGEPLPVNKYYLSRGPSLKKILDLSGVSLIVAEKGQDPAAEYFASTKYQPDLTKIYSDDRLEVYRNKTAIPRFGLYYDVRQNVSDSEILRLISDGSVDLNKTVLLEDTLTDEFKAGSGSAKLISSTVNSQIFEAQTDITAVFYVSDAYYPGWKAVVNGKKVPIYRANYNFRAIIVPKGKSTVIFSYSPTWWNETIGVSLVSLLGLMILSFRKRKTT